MQEKKTEKKELKPLASEIAKKAYGYFEKKGFREISARFKNHEELAEHIKKEENLMVYLRLLTAFPPLGKPIENVDEGLIRNIRVLLLRKKLEPKIEH